MIFFLLVWHDMIFKTNLLKRQFWCFTWKYSNIVWNNWICNIFLISVVKSNTKFIAPHLKHDKRIIWMQMQYITLKINLPEIYSFYIRINFRLFLFDLTALNCSDICQSSKIESEWLYKLNAFPIFLRFVCIFCMLLHGILKTPIDFCDSFSADNFPVLFGSFACFIHNLGGIMIF